VTTESNDILAQHWTLHMTARSMSPRTIELYRSVLDMFRDHLGDADLLEVTRRDAESFFADMRARGLAQATMRGRWIALRNFYGWLVEEEEITSSPLEKVKVAKADPPPPNVVDDDTLKALFATCDRTTLQGVRDLAIMRLMAGAGLRVSEVANLRLADVDLTQRLVTVVGKGDRIRVVRIDPTTGDAVARYIRRRARHRDHRHQNLWLGLHGPLTRGGIQTMFDMRSELIGTNVHPHMLRHTWAHRWLARGGNEGDLQILGGWENPDVMRRYGSALATDRALAAYDDVDPLGDL
jgi:site-specific recombinase XerD